MKVNKTIIGLGCFLSVVFLAFGHPNENPAFQTLPSYYKNWLERDTAYIISAKERDVFLKLQTDKERDLFIEAFWKQRDPTPGTPEDEFKVEHYRRIAYANEHFVRETTRPGWQTDRGRIYILLGPPSDIAKVEGEGTVYPSEIWYYDGKTQYGLPPHFTLVFFRRDGIGEHVLYSPMVDGPGRLLINYQGDPAHPEDAYEKIRRYDSRLAQSSLSYIPDEIPFLGRPSLSSEMILSQIEAVPEKMADTNYAEAFLKYKDLVEVEYTANYISSDSLLRVIQDDSGLFFIHYAIEPKKLSVLSYDNRYSLNFKLNGILTNSEGRTIFQYEKNMPVDFNKDEIEDIRKTSLVLQDMVPMIPGDYKLSLLLKNTVSKEFTSLEGRVTIPQNFRSLQMSPLLLGYQLKKIAADRDFNKPFKVGNDQISCQTGHSYHAKETLVVFFQTYGPARDLERIRNVRYSFLRNGKEFLTRMKDMPAPPPQNILEEFPLQNFTSGLYKIKAAILDSEGQEIFSEAEDFEISSLAGIPRAWIVSKVMPSSKNIEYSYILGNQYVQTENFAQAERLLKKAYDGNTASLKYGVSYAQLLSKTKDYQKAKSILLPFAERGPGNDQVLCLLGSCCQASEEYQEALSYYHRYLSQAGTNLVVVNAIGECYYRLGNLREALITWEKSLDINPRQESLQKRVAELKRKKS